jgi:predicted DsbA family dithiol-disulfide isomerase
MAEVVVEVWSDIACPWCYIGSRHLERTLADTDHDVAVRWRAFQLDPTLDVEGITNAERLVAKFGGRANYEAAVARVSTVGADVGIEFDHETAIAVNTERAHQLVAAGQAQGLGDPVVGRLFSAYCEGGERVSDPAVLRRVAADAGLEDPEEIVTGVLEGRWLEDVQADVGEAAELGIRGVHTFVANRRVAVSGAVPPEVMHRLLDQATGGA